MSWINNKQALLDVIRLGLSLPSGKIRWGFENVARSSEPSASLYRASSRGTGLPIVTKTDYSDRCVIDTLQPVELKIKVDYFGPEAFEHLASLALYCRTDSALGPLNSSGFGFMDSNEPQSIPTLYHSNYVDRAIVVLTFSAYLSTQETVNYISTVETTGTISTPDGASFTQTDTFTVD